MPQKRFLQLIFTCFYIFFMAISVVFGFEDGFGPAKNIRGKYLSTYYSPELDLSSMLENLNIGLADRLMIGKRAKTNSSIESELAEMIDTLFMRVSDILDMHIYSFEGKIKICKDQQHLASIYRHLFNNDLGNNRSFYVSNLNTIYISENSFTKEVLGHEIAHAIISRYFVVQPSIKVSEILSGYVEYQLRKSK